MRVKNIAKVKIFLIGIIFLFLFLSIYICLELAPKNYLQVSFLDVGQGDAVLFQTPRGGKILVDGGRDKKVLEKLGTTLPIVSKKIELVIATHDDSDHITGLIDVLKKYEVKVLLYSLPSSESLLSKELVKVAQEKNTQVVKIFKPVIIKTDDGLIIKIMFPVSDLDRKIVGNESQEIVSNDASIVTQFIFGNTKILLTGDLSQAGEKFLISRYNESLKSNILKLGHHGSDTSSNVEFLQIVQPEVAVASVGENNSFGHPHRSVLDLCEKIGIKVYRTDVEDTITFRSNGINFWRE